MQLPANWIPICREALELCWSLLVQAASIHIGRRELMDGDVQMNNALLCVERERG